MNLDKFSLNGELRPMTEAVIPIANLEYAYGFGVYETLRVLNHLPYFAKEHATRLLSSAATIGLAHAYSVEKLERHINDLVDAIKEEAAYNLKIILVGDKQPEEALLYIFPLAPFFPDKVSYRDGVRTITKEYERPFPNAKTLSMLESYLAFTEARKNNCYDALIVGRDGKITEGTASNFFLVKGRTIYAAPGERILEGVTMKIVLSLAEKNDFQVETQLASPQELPDYEGAFLTSTSGKIMPIREVDNFQFSSIPETTRVLMRLYDDFLAGCGGCL
jgi:branched-subunit amino acid aminotransferase/4-amino-4-deoxychorismate lyase